MSKSTDSGRNVPSCLLPPPRLENVNCHSTSPYVNFSSTMEMRGAQVLEVGEADCIYDSRNSSGGDAGL